jgi:hypothetical protein
MIRFYLENLAKIFQKPRLQLITRKISYPCLSTVLISGPLDKILYKYVRNIKAISSANKNQILLIDNCFRHETNGPTFGCVLRIGQSPI